MALNAFGLVVEATKATRNPLTAKQVQQSFRSQRQSQARQTQANRDRQRQQSRTAERNRQQQQRSVAQRQQARQRKTDIVNQRDRSRKLDINKPNGKVQHASEVEWLNKLSGEEREVKEAEMLQSIAERGNFTFIDAAKGNSWVEEVAEDWEPDLDDIVRGQYPNQTYANMTR